jgi:hypothetical protein
MTHTGDKKTKRVTQVPDLTHHGNLKTYGNPECETVPAVLPNVQ